MNIQNKLSPLLRLWENDTHTNTDAKKKAKQVFYRQAQFQGNIPVKEPRKNS